MLSIVSNKWCQFRSYIYDTFIVAMTTVWYREVLVDVPVGARILDVGIGTATSLLDNRDIIVSKKLKVVGVDYDQDYVDTAQANTKKHKLDSQVNTVCKSIHDYEGEGFDVIYFSGSFMIIPNKVEALRRCVDMLKKNPTTGKREGTIYFTQTFEQPGLVGYMMSFVKPLLKFLLTIDFGGVTYEKDFRKVLGEAGVHITALKVIEKTAFRSQVIAVAKP